jgi:hypothetical protein
MYQNLTFIFTLGVIVVYNIYKLMILDQWNRDFYELADLSLQFRYKIVYMIVLNLLLSFFAEYFSSKWFKAWWTKRKNKE